jgi:tRNA nucleotidyltransferase (CCA-adding enzyme)
MELIKQIAQDIKAIGGDLLIVGGFVRDMHLKRDSKDIDCEIYRITPDQLQTVLGKYGKVKLVGESFGSYKLIVKGQELPYEFTFPRTERKTGEGYRGFDVSLDPNMSIEEAARRRDLTINAMLYCPLTGITLDPYKGLDDLKRGLIRHVDSKTFAEDPLRVLRVAQFAARFDFVVDDTTKALCTSLLHEMHTLSRERFYIELEKILMKAVKPSIAFRFMLDAGVLAVVFPELARMKTIQQGRKHHPEGDAFEHTMLALDSVPVEHRRIDLMLAILCHDFGKAVVDSIVEDNGEIVHHYGHAEAGDDIIKSFLARFTNETRLTDTVLNLSRLHMRPYELMNDMSKRNVRRLALKVNIEDLCVVHIADLGGKNNGNDTSHVDRLITIYQEIKDEIKPLVSGNDIMAYGIRDGKQIGKIKTAAFNAQLDGAFNTHANGIEYMLDHRLLPESGLNRLARKIKRVYRRLLCKA